MEDMKNVTALTVTNDVAVTPADEAAMPEYVELKLEDGTNCLAHIIAVLPDEKGTYVFVQPTQQADPDHPLGFVLKVGEDPATGEDQLQEVATDEELAYAVGLFGAVTNQTPVLDTEHSIPASAKEILGLTSGDPEILPFED